ncbi:hypothetical protein D9M71_835120 [compost metagenome]
MDARRVEALAVQRHVVVGVLQAPAQTLQLVLAQFVDAGGFHRVEQGDVGDVHIHGFTRCYCAAALRGAVSA